MRLIMIRVIEEFNQWYAMPWLKKKVLTGVCHHETGGKKWFGEMGAPPNSNQKPAP